MCILRYVLTRDGRAFTATRAKVSPELISILLVGVALAGFLWNLHRDIADLRERMARLEGLLEGFTKAGA